MEDTIVRDQISKKEDIKRFMLGGRAIFTLQTEDCRLTYQVKKMKKGVGFAVSILTGSNNTSDYQYIGTLWDNKNTVKFVYGRTSNISSDAPSVSFFEEFMEEFNLSDRMFYYTFWHEGKCARCSRLLTDPESIKRGFGAECWSKLK